MITVEARIQQLQGGGTLQALADTLGMDFTYLSKLRHGDKVVPDYQTLRKLGLHQVTTYELLDDSTQGTRWRHKKRGTSYTEVGRGQIQVGDFPPKDMDMMVVYRGDDGALWIRPVSEFEDGRFERVT